MDDEAQARSAIDAAERGRSTGTRSSGAKRVTWPVAPFSQREPATIHARALIEALSAIPVPVSAAIETRSKLETAIAEARAERIEIRATGSADDWRAWRDSFAAADAAGDALDRVLDALEGQRPPAELAIIHAITAAAAEIHAQLAADLAALLDAAARAAAAFKGQPIPSGDALPHLSPARAAAWRTLDEGSSRYGALRGGERQLRALIGASEPDPALAEFSDPAAPELWGSLDRWRNRKQSGFQPGPSSGRPLDRFAWLAGLGDLVWLPDAAQERALFERVRIKNASREAALGAFVPQG
jgi:hypothetical protein